MDRSGDIMNEKGNRKNERGEPIQVEKWGSGIIVEREGWGGWMDVPT